MSFVAIQYPGCDDDDKVDGNGDNDKDTLKVSVNEVKGSGGESGGTRQPLSNGDDTGAGLVNGVADNQGNNGDIANGNGGNNNGGTVNGGGGDDGQGNGEEDGGDDADEEEGKDSDGKENDGEEEGEDSDGEEEAVVDGDESEGDENDDDDHRMVPILHYQDAGFYADDDDEGEGGVIVGQVSMCCCHSWIELAEMIHGIYVEVTLEENLNNVNPSNCWPGCLVQFCTHTGFPRYGWHEHGHDNFATMAKDLFFIKVRPLHED